jgi:glycosyltransferase involved in cell wall biosynthesis
MAKISVCIPSYNHARYISHTIESVLNQSFTDFEIIISDDNSQDNSIEIIKNFKDTRIKLIENKQNQGPSVNANIAIENASSNFIALIASDDMMHKTRLEKTFNFLTSNPNIDAVFTSVQTIDRNNKEIDHFAINESEKFLDSKYKILNYFFYTGNCLSAPTVMFKKDILSKIGSFNPCLLQTQDFDIWTKMLVKGYNIGFIKEKLTYYRIGDNLSCINGGMDSKFLSRMCVEMEKILENFLEINSIEEFLKIFPDVKDEYKIIEQKYITFYLMKEAIKISQRRNDYRSYWYKQFAINIAFKLMNDKELRSEISQNFNFKMKDFLDLTSHNIFIEEIISYKTKANQARKKGFLSLNFFGIHKKTFKERLGNGCKKLIANIKKICRNEIN